MRVRRTSGEERRWGGQVDITPDYGKLSASETLVRLSFARTTSSYRINGAGEAGEVNSSITVAVLRLDSATFECLIVQGFRRCLKT
jgi:hypothetical protein